MFSNEIREILIGGNSLENMATVLVIILKEWLSKTCGTILVEIQRTVFEEAYEIDHLMRYP